MTIHGTLKEQMIRGSSLMLLLQISQRAIGFVSLGLLTRLLTPSDFGLVAVAAAASGVLTSAIATNFSTAVISLPKPERSDYDTAWTLNAIRGVVLALVVASVAFVMSLRTSASVSQVLLALSLLPLLEGFRNIGMASLRRGLEFFPIMCVEMVSRLAGGVGAVLVALVTASHWALVTGTVLSAAVGLVGTFFASTYRPQLDLSSWRKLWAVSGWLAGSSLVTIVSIRIDVFFVSHYLGLAVAGIYNTGSEIGEMFYGQVIVPLLTSLFPGLARLADVRESYLRAFRKAREVLVGVCLPVGIGLSLVADGFVRIALGPGWDLAGPVIAIVSLAYTIHLATIGMDEALLSIRRTQPIFVRQLLAALLRLCLVLGGLYVGGFVGLLIGRLAAALTVAALNARLLCRELGIPARELVAPHMRPIIAAAAMAGVSTVWRFSVERQGISISAVALLADVLLGAVVYTSVLVSLWIASKRPDGFEREAWSVITSRLSRQAAS